MTTKQRESALDRDVPQTGIAADAYNVACTAVMLAGRGTKDKIISPLGMVSAHAVTLHRISGQLHRLAERDCNFGLGARDLRRVENLEADAQEIASHYGLTCYFQGDPRGCSLYLIDPGMIPGKVEDLIHGSTPESRAEQRWWIDANYNRGHAVARLGR